MILPRQTKPLWVTEDEVVTTKDETNAWITWYVAGWQWYTLFDFSNHSTPVALRGTSVGIFAHGLELGLVLELTMARKNTIIQDTPAWMGV